MELFAGLAVRDLAASVRWCSVLLGSEPAFYPHDAEAVWQVAEHRFVYAVVRPDPGGGLVTVIVEDLDERVAAARAAGIEPDEEETHGNGVRKVTFRDPDGNEVGLGGLPG